MDKVYLIITFIIQFADVPVLSKLGKVSKEIRNAVIDELPNIANLTSAEIRRYQTMYETTKIFKFRRSFWRALYRDVLFRPVAININPYIITRDYQPEYDSFDDEMMPYNPMYVYGLSLIAARDGFPSAKIVVAKLMASEPRGMSNSTFHFNYNCNSQYFYWVQLPELMIDLKQFGHIFGRPSFMKTLIYHDM